MKLKEVPEVVSNLAFSGTFRSRRIIQRLQRGGVSGGDLQCRVRERQTHTHMQTSFLTVAQGRSLCVTLQTALPSSNVKRHIHSYGSQTIQTSKVTTKDTKTSEHLLNMQYRLMSTGRKMRLIFKILWKPYTNLCQF